MPKNFRTRRDSSSSSSDEDDKVKTSENVQTEPLNFKEKIEEIKFLQKQRQRTHGLDVYSLAVGEVETASKDISKLIENDPWKTKTGGLVDMRIVLEKRGNEIVKNMHSNFAKETNQRDEDAEMQKFIEEQLRLKREAEKAKQSISATTSGDTEVGSSFGTKKYKTPDEALFDVPKFLIENKSKMKSEETLSEQMLSGIPEVDLGVEERIKNIEETEKAKQKLLSGNFSSAEPSTSRNENLRYGNKRKIEVDGDAARPSNTRKKDGKEKASDDFAVEKFKKNMRYSRNSRIRIA